MDWGNAIVRSKTTNAAGEITAIAMELHLDGDFRKTKKKITWLSQSTAAHPLTPVILLDYDYLITKKKLEENDTVADFVTPVTEFRQAALADANVSDLKKGEIMQFERKGYFAYDGIVDGNLEFIKIPDGKVASLASKAGVPVVVDAPKTESAPPVTKMYASEKVYGEDVKADGGTTMYKVENIYKS